MLHLLNLSLSILLRSIYRITPLSMSYLQYLATRSQSRERTMICLFNVHTIALDSLCFCAMYLLTGDRLICIILGLRYPVLYRWGKTFLAIVSVWIFCVLLGLFFFLQNYYLIPSNEDLRDLNHKLFVYFPTIQSTIFLVFASVSYLVIFHHFVLSRRATMQDMGDGSSRQSAWFTFRHSKFFTCILLLTTHIVLVVIPLYLAIKIKHPKFQLYANISFYLSDTVHGLLYVVAQPEVWDRFVEGFCRCASGCNCKHKYGDIEMQQQQQSRNVGISSMMPTGSTPVHQVTTDRVATV